MKSLSFIIAIFYTLIYLSGCSVSEGKIRSIDSNIIKVLDSWSPLYSALIYRQGLPIELGSSDQNYVFEIHAQNGSFNISSDNKIQRTTDLICSSSEIIYWLYYAADETDEPWHGTTTFIDVIIRKGEHYVGYGVIKIESPNDIGVYNAIVVECKEFPRIWNRYQNISLEEITQMINAAKRATVQPEG